MADPIGPVNQKLPGTQPSGEPPKKELSSLGYIWKSFIELPSNIYLLMLRISSAVASAFGSSQQKLENASAISKAVDLKEPYKKMDSILKEIMSTELNFVNGLKELMVYQKYFSEHSDDEIIASTGIALDKNDLKNIREYLDGIALCYQVNSAFYNQIKEASKDKPLSAIEIFMQHDFMTAFKPMASKCMELLQSCKKTEIKRLWKNLQTTLFSASEKPKNPENLFITPIQRIPRYTLLFKEMGKEAEKAQLPEHQKQVIRNGVERAQNIAEAMNAP